MCFKTLMIFILICLFSTALFAQKTRQKTRQAKPKTVQKSLKIEQESSRVKNFGKSLLKDSVSTEKISVKQSNEDEDVIKVETNLVTIDVLVIDKQGNTVKGLEKSDFIVIEDTIEQEIGTFSLGDSLEVPRSIVLIIDYSGSQIPYLKTSMEAAKLLVDKLNPKDKMAIVTDDVELLVDFTSDKRLLKRKLDSVYDNVKNGYFVETEFVKGKLGKSLQYNSLLATLNELFSEEDLRPIVLFQTDGDQFFNIKSKEKRPFGILTEYKPDYTVEELFDKIERSKATIYSIVSGDSLLKTTKEQRIAKAAEIENEANKVKNIMKQNSEWYQRYVERMLGEQSSMESISQISGGFVESLEKPEQASEIYTRIFEGIRNRYLIGYYPINQGNDGKRRNVKIEVKNHPEYTILSRKFYFSPSSK